MPLKVKTLIGAQPSQLPAKYPRILYRSSDRCVVLATSAHGGTALDCVHACSIGDRADDNSETTWEAAGFGPVQGPVTVEFLNA